MNAHNGKVLSVANAQNGILCRALAAATTGMSGFGGGGPAGAAAWPARRHGRCAGRGRRRCGGAGGAGTFGRSGPAFGLGSCGLAALQQVLGIWVTSPTIDAEMAGSGNPHGEAAVTAFTYSQPVDCRHRVVDRNTTSSRVAAKIGDRRRPRD